MSEPPVSRRLPTTGRLFAVVDDPADAPPIVAELHRAGIASSDVTLLRGAEGAARLDAAGRATGARGRLRQALSFTMVDQMPDLFVYEAALLDGRSVLAVRVRSDARRREIRDVLRARGAHFINVYGRFATEEIAPWRGPELDIADYLRR